MSNINVTTQKLSMEKIPPQNTEAEIALLGSMLIEEAAISKAIELIDAGAFYKESHRIIYKTMLDLFNRNSAIDLITLIEELKKRGELDNSGGAAYLTS
ncbi:MAG: DnaB-like helicase N-terminal domain-containing protein [Candidatus Omnitrophota bacterium]|nr:DnaB-like helicase N-terminal domain-containing protein [Candidatus Omnitrophota bacterium]